jgi:sorting nexin-4
MEDEIFDSVTWDTPSPGGYDPIIEDGRKKAESSTSPGYRQEGAQTASDEPKWEGYLEVEVKDPIKELEGTKDMYISYRVYGQVRGRHKFALDRSIAMTPL